MSLSDFIKNKDLIWKIQKLIFDSVALPKQEVNSSGLGAASMDHVQNSCSINILNFQLMFINSTRLFFARPSSVPLGATGFSSP